MRRRWKRREASLFPGVPGNKADGARDGRVFEFLNVVDYGHQDIRVLLQDFGVLLLGTRVLFLSARRKFAQTPK